MPPAAANDGGKSSHKGQSHSSVTKSAAADSKNTKICHIVKRSDFDGYGFNLHTEKSKPGQYIGKVDANSPAEAAGLSEGYRILEVNGIPINNETHKQVVQRIKAIAWEVKLLVSTDAADSVKAGESSSKTAEKQPNNNGADKNHNKMATNNGSGSGSGSGNGTAAAATKTAKPTTPPTVPPLAATAAAAMNSDANAHANNGKHAASIEMVSSPKSTAPTTTTTTTATITPPPPPSMTTKMNDAAAPSPSSASALKLPSTAAEMRAILQSKKKFNPKSEEVNLQEKYEIIQKL